MRLTFRSKLFLSFALIFALFAICAVVIEQLRQRSVRKEALIEQLNIYATMVERIVVEQNSDWQEKLYGLEQLFPRPIRISVIEESGQVAFDNTIEDILSLENHRERKEITLARSIGEGVDVRTSISDGREYIYLARKTSIYYVRVALPYDMKTKNWLRADNVFLFWLIALFLALLFFVSKMAGAMGRTIRRLRDFAVATEKESFEPSFSNDELGEIGTQISSNYRLLQEKNREIGYERDRLSLHILTSKEGIAFFDADYKVTFFNGLFLQYLNTLSDSTYTEPSKLFEEPFFTSALSFLKEQKEHCYEEQICYQRRIFSLRLNRFEDNGIEVVLNDATANEKTRLLKQEMTANIAHELRTPITSIRGYLETILEHPLAETERVHFIRQAYNKTLSLSEIIRDMSLLAKMEEASDSFVITQVEMSDIRKKLEQEFSVLFEAQRSELVWRVEENVVVEVNENLFYTIFRNLTENALKYAGEEVRIVIELYRKDKEYFYFSFYDTGQGIVDERHLTRLFERFYRINQGRTRETGGTGLGLSIVKNAILFHKGDIIVKNRTQGGLEFLFRIKQ
ncbi:hypothetical protein HQ36_06350 [Porphyromonas gingivicanis]|uniref:histidine kinase n=1 Tax=Porphyromonas gingivicanis TaxID=266762 RepID=A0A0A2G2Q1_9PORP|nr:ATP-binding protein [Porphyromonas gingivicanis]KGN97511.1 hypothetical protein HQ36_06350 [Porphyromonas gingivicanis]